MTHLRRFVLALSAVSAVSALSTLSAQTATASGRVLRPGKADTVPLPGARVLLHHVGRNAQGPIDSAVTDAGGRFRFRFRPDTTSLYLLSTRYGGIEYFSPPVHTNPERPDTNIRLLAYDTSSTAPVAVEARHIVLPRAGPDGTRAALDFIVLRNDGLLARVAPDSAHPSWTMTLPPATGAMQVGESDLSPDAVVRQGDSVKVLAPLAPGQKQLALEYPVAPTGGRIQFTVEPGEALVDVLVEERDARVSGGTLGLADSQVIEGRSFRRWTGQVPGGGTITVSFGGSGLPGWQVLAALVVPVAGALGFAGWRMLRRRSTGVEPESRERLLDAIAALDARYAGRKAETPAKEWRGYEADRAALKARLESALAAGDTSRYV